MTMMVGNDKMSRLVLVGLATRVTDALHNSTNESRLNVMVTSVLSAGLPVMSLILCYHASFLASFKQWRKSSTGFPWSQLRGEAFTEAVKHFRPFPRAIVARMSSLRHFYSRSRKASSDPGVATHGGSPKIESTHVLVDGVDNQPDSDVNPGELTFEEDTAGGIGRHLGIFDCTMLIVGGMVGTGIFSTPSSVIGSVGSVGASLMLWVLGFALSFAGLFIWLELGTMIPRSGGEKVYLEAMFRRPRNLATVIYATTVILLDISSGNCLVFAEKCAPNACDLS